MGRVTFETEALRKVFKGDEDLARKVDELCDRAPNYGTPGPTQLDGQAKHCHVTNQVGIAWKYETGAFQNPVEEPIAHILALGKKIEQKGRGQSGYNWSDTGDV